MLSSDHIKKNQHTSQDNFHSTHGCRNGTAKISTGFSLTLEACSSQN